MGRQVTSLEHQLGNAEACAALREQVTNQSKLIESLKNQLDDRQTTIRNAKREHFRLMADIQDLRVQLHESQEECEEDRKESERVSNRWEEARERGIEAEAKLALYIEAHKKIVEQFF